MSAIFFHNYWDIVGTNITNMVLNVLNSNAPMAEINKTNISLIPKTNHPTRMTELCPISLCNVTYKLISKVLANRLKTVMPSIISENQGAFTTERLISDNVLVAYEFMHYLKNKKGGKESFMSIKLDMSKAFDRVEWDFIRGIMMKLGFNNKLTNLIMHCVSSVSYSLIINGETFGHITPTRGIRQGDPLSPYLFLLCAEGLSALIHDVARNQQISGVSICRGCPIITHLFFADDSLLFYKANVQECQKLFSILQSYEAASGQKINADKSLVFFSPNTPQETKECILRFLRPMQDSRHNKYLELPSIIGKSKPKCLLKSRNKWLKSLLVGKVNSFQLVGGKFSLRQSHKQSQPVP